ncbi:MAG: SurA N-terminal domain-containing protein [Phreatobacter sp.]|uniref:peptidylprolyl isomerase n=1 Tax=Phreatobacter sp. TaxID=1966341 RepID=UPI001A4AA903|nr:peptidylprolyl isomerase [Phreatobacter sp.]MBL8569944.1 SurA N-terminal domain-containing protein [Phreatobacter sp.]
MLTGLRNTFAKGIMRGVLIALMGLLVASFAVWGIGDIFRGGTSTTLAQVGSTQISVQSFQTAYNREVQNLGRMLGRGVTPDQARQFGIDQRILGQLLTDATLDERGRQLGLGIDDDTIRTRIMSTPSFRGPTGQFDRTAFQELLRQNGYTEPVYIELERRLAVRQQIAGAVSDRMSTPQALIDAMTRFQNETRAAQYFVVGSAQVGDIAAPDAAALQAYFDANKAAFRAPEYRKLVLLTLSPDEQVGFQQVPPEQVEAELSRLRETSERRTIQQISFPNAEDAAAAAAKIKEGLSFDDLAKERSIAPADLAIGHLARAQVTDPAVRDAAFSLAENVVSEPVRGAFGTVLLRVTKIDPFNVEQAREQARLTLARNMARGAVNDLHDKIERERSSGLPLADIAAKVGLSVTTVDAVDAQGNDPAGVQLNLVGASDFLAPAFRAEVGLENEPANNRQSGLWVWYEVAGITPARDRALDEVKDRVEARWREDEVRQRIGKLADEITAEIAGGKPVAEVAQARSLEVRTTPALPRSGTDGPWGAAAVQRLFSTPKGQAANAPAADGIDRLVFVTGDIVLPANAALDQRTRDQLQQSIEDDVLTQYISRLQRDFGSTVNQTQLTRAIGGTAQ